MEDMYDGRNELDSLDEMLPSMLKVLRYVLATDEELQKTRPEFTEPERMRLIRIWVGNAVTFDMDLPRQDEWLEIIDKMIGASFIPDETKIDPIYGMVWTGRKD